MQSAMRFLLGVILLSWGFQLPAADWEVLFDGKSFAGWDLHRTLGAGAPWVIEDGCLKSVSLTGMHGQEQFVSRTDLVTVEKFHDFDLRFEWKISHGGNSGVKYRLQGYLRPKPGVTTPRGVDDLFIDAAALTHGAPHDWFIYSIGFEYQITDDQVAPDALSSARRSTAALYDLLPAAKSGPAAAGVFHSSRIVVRGSHFEHWLDGKLVLSGDFDSAEFHKAVEAARERWRARLRAGKIDPWNTPQSRFELFDALSAQRVREAPIALQHHASGVWFRNIRIRRL